MQKSSWKKCDLQVATPAWDFSLPAGSNYDFSRPEDRQNFLDIYMQGLRAKGIEVIALADHNTGEWIDDAKMAGKRHGVIVFPGCEVTTSSGSDGIHLVVIGDLSKTSQDFDRLLESSLGFTAVRRFNERNQPASSTKTVDQILDDLPDGYIAIAPHAFSENGLASSKTASGDIRRKALDHPKLSAIDPGDCANIDGDTFRHRFCRRELDNFARLRSLPFIATSDAYSIESLGARFTWIRMGDPTLEALRQAFLDHDARILCDWDPRLSQFPQRNPNSVRHAWIEAVELDGTLGNSQDALRVNFHPNLNVVIGGRGSGKSTLIAALRQIYEPRSDLPDRVRAEVERFADLVFPQAVLSSVHRLQESQEEQRAVWTRTTGSLRDGTAVRTDFPIQIFVQKELFERAAGDKQDPNLASRSLLGLIDQGVDLYSHSSQGIGSLPRQIEDDKQAWIDAARCHCSLMDDLAKLPSLKEKERTLRSQVNAFSAPEVAKLLEDADIAGSLNKNLSRSLEQLSEKAQRMKQALNELDQFWPPKPAQRNPSYDACRNSIERIREAFVDGVTSAVNEVETYLSNLDSREEFAEWKAAVAALDAKVVTYKEGLADRGLSPDAFTSLKQELETVEAAISDLALREKEVDASSKLVSDHWISLMETIGQVRLQRNQLLQSIQERTNQVRFKLLPFKDEQDWIERVRHRIGLRSDGFLQEVPALARWLWHDASLREQRWEQWRACLVTGDLDRLTELTGLRPQFVERLAGLDDSVRYVLATEVPHDVVEMYFLRSNGDPASDGDWQPLAEGSPGQRTAAMLAFVLQHGSEPLVIDQPEDDLDSEWISRLVVSSLRDSRWSRQIIVVTHNANIPVLGDADQIIALENVGGSLRIRSTNSSDGDLAHVGPVEYDIVRADVQRIMEGGIDAFLRRERRYNAEALSAKSAG